MELHLHKTSPFNEDCNFWRRKLRKLTRVFARPMKSQFRNLISGHGLLTLFRLRQTDVKAGHFERKVQALEQDRDAWESKYEEMAKKYAAVHKELEDFQQEIGNM